MPIHPDWRELYHSFIEQYGEEKGKSVFYAYCEKHSIDYTKPKPKKEGFSWAGSIKEMPGVDNLIRGKALHPLRTVHPEEWPQVREYLEEELEKSAHTLAGKPLILDHFQVLRGKVLGAEYEDGAIEYVAQLNDPEVMELVRNGAIKHCSVEFEWKSLKQVNGVAPLGINFTGLSLLRLFEPGDPLTTVEVWEGIIKELKEAKNVRRRGNPGSSTAKEQAEPQQFIFYVIRDAMDFIPEMFSTTWVDEGIQAITGRLREHPDTETFQALLFMKANNWTLEKMQDWLQNHPQYLRGPAPSQPGIQPVGGVTGVLKMNEEELKQFVEAQVKAILKEQQNQEPEKDEHGCVIGKERWDPEKNACVPIEKPEGPEAVATEQQGNQEPEKDEHGCIIGKERYDEEQDKCVPITAEARIAFLETSLKLKEQDAELTVEEIKQKIADLTKQKEELHNKLYPESPLSEEEKAAIQAQISTFYAEIQAYEQALATKIAGQAPPPETPSGGAKPVEEKKKGLGEAIIAPGAPSEPSDLISKQEVFALIPERRIWRSWSYGPQRLVQDLKRKLKESEA